MTDAEPVAPNAEPTHEPEPSIQAKQPPPNLSTRAPRPQAVRLRKSVVQLVVMGGAVLISGSLAWAFVIQPDLRNSARVREAQAREERAHGVVRPTESVTDQPADYDRLPDPRFGATEEVSDDASGDQPSTSATTSYAAGPSVQVAPQPRAPSPRDQALRSDIFFAGAGGVQQIAPVAAPQAVSEPGGDIETAEAFYNRHRLVAPVSPFELKAGAIVPAALLTAIDTARSGPVVAAVTQNVYDTVRGRHLLLPQGSRLIGRHEGASAYGDRRAFLIWERLILPNGKSLVLTGEPGVDAQGAIGVQGQVDRRLWPLLVGTLFAGAITTLGQVARDDDEGSRSLLNDAGDAAAIQGAQTGGQLVSRELEVRPSIRLSAGAPVRVLITRDLVLEPYQP